MTTFGNKIQVSDPTDACFLFLFEIVVLKQVKVKAYTRTRFGKKEMVRSHLSERRVAQTEATVTVSK